MNVELLIKKENRVELFNFMKMLKYFLDNNLIMLKRKRSSQCIEKRVKFCLDVIPVFVYDKCIYDNSENKTEEPYCPEKTLQTNFEPSPSDADLNKSFYEVDEEQEKIDQERFDEILNDEYFKDLPKLICPIVNFDFLYALTFEKVVEKDLRGTESNNEIIEEIF